MKAIAILDAAIAEIDHKILAEKQAAVACAARIEAMREVRDDLDNHRQAETNRATNGPADVHYDLPKVN